MHPKEQHEASVDTFFLAEDNHPGSPAVSEHHEIISSNLVFAFAARSRPGKGKRRITDIGISRISRIFLLSSSQFRSAVGLPEKRKNIWLR